MIIDFNSIIEDDEEIKSFKTYNNYLLSFRQCLESMYGKKPEIFHNLKDACDTKPAFLKIQTNKKADLGRIKKLLFNSWHTEIVFSIPKQVDVELVKYSNHWAPIQAYYSIFLSLRALFEGMGIDCPNTHTSTLQQISKCIVDRDLLPAPWNSYHCGLKELNNLSYNNFQKQCMGISNLATPLTKDFWSWYGLWLKTTRDRKYEKRREDVLRGKRFKKANGKPRKNLNIDQKKTVDDGLHATTLFDGLYRLRIRSNYEDADAFILGAMSPNDAVTFYDSLILILQSSLFVIEKSVARYISFQCYEKIVNEFIKNIKGDIAKDTIGLRTNYI